MELSSRVNIQQRKAAYMRLALRLYPRHSNKGTTAAGGNGNSAEPTTAPQVNDTNQPTQPGSDKATSAIDNSGKPTTVAQNGQETETAGSKPTTFVGTESLETTSSEDVGNTEPKTSATAESFETTSAGANSEQSTTVAGNIQSTQVVAIASQSIFAQTQSENIQTTSVGENSARSTTVAGNIQSESSESISVHDNCEHSTTTAGSEHSTTQSVGNEAQPTTRPAETESNSPETTTGFPTEEIITPIQDAQPVQEDCLGQNLIDKGDFEHAGDGWEMYGNAALTYNGEFGPNSRTNSGQSAVAIRWPQANGVRAAFKRTVPSLIPGMPYLFGWAYHIASGEGLLDNMCTITAKFDIIFSLFRMPGLITVTS
ncbi:uncharacterized protein FTOL_00793 [Fusarium torulosum]|uniref:Uncharacterized protein n=1 Tax=Fusarium torulosum TaxID=33205 RepID=A0AAE8LYZ1_9HYPO|nr:uncharacterized protein FTOL_00793 [Fusarium torulosum]